MLPSVILSFENITVLKMTGVIEKMPMNRSACIKLLIVPVIVLSIGFITSILVSTDKKPLLLPKEQKKFSSPHSMRGLTYSTYNDNRLTAELKADRFSIDQRKFWVFNIRPFQDAVFDNAEVKVYLDRDKSLRAGENATILSFGEDILTLNKQRPAASGEKGAVSRGVIRGLVMEIHEADGPSIIIKAKKAYIDAVNRKLKLVNVLMEDVASGKLIRSRIVKWNNEKSAFEIAGRYIMKEKDVISNGEKIMVDLDFNITPLTYARS